MSGLGQKAEVSQPERHVRFTPGSGHRRADCSGPKRATTGLVRSFDYLVGTGEQRRRHGEAKSLGGL
jgi:hypothetical protein